MNTTNADKLPSFADIQWDEHGQPFSSRFNDVYFTRQDGLNETRFVYLDKNQLQHRWQKNLNQSCFTIGETGFGSGLNFIATWQLWNQCNTKELWLHYISIEKHPFHLSDLLRASELWPELKDLYQEFIAAYPATAVKGFYTLVFPKYKIRLTLIIDDIQNALDQLLQSSHPLFQRATNQIGIDAWFLDGFAPSKNSDMWQESAIEKIARLSSPTSTLATFSAAGTVRRSLQAAGFKVEKYPGFGTKREMIYAEFSSADSYKEEFPESLRQASSRRSGHEVPWFLDAAKTNMRTEVQEESGLVAIIGAGLSACQTAYALAQRGRKVILLEKNSDIASAASGANQGVVYGKLSADDDGLAQLNLTSLLYAHGFYQQFWNHQEGVKNNCGVLQLAHNTKEKKLWQDLKYFYQNRSDIFSFINAKNASDIAGINIEHDAISFPSLGWIQLKTLCKQLTSHPNIKIRTNCAVENLVFGDGKTPSWSLHNKTGDLIVEAESVVIANATNSLNFEQVSYLPLKAIRGQLSYLHGELVNKNIRSVICGSAYIAPSTLTQNGEKNQTLGATFTLHNHSTELSLDDHQTNISVIDQQTPSALPWLHAQKPKNSSYTSDLQRYVDQENLSGFTDFRCSTPDYLPIVGPVPRYEDFISDFALLRKNALANIPTSGNYWPGLHVNVGYGSRGLAYSPICAELLAAQICGDILPLSRNLVKALHPARFIIRDLARNKI